MSTAQRAQQNKNVVANLRRWPELQRRPADAAHRSSIRRPARNPGGLGSRPARTSQARSPRPRQPIRAGRKRRRRSAPTTCSSSRRCWMSSARRSPAASAPNMARLTRTPWARSRAASRWWISSAASRICSREISAATSARTSTRTATANPWASWRESLRSIFPPWFRCGCTRWPSPAATLSSSSLPSATRPQRCSSPNCCTKQDCLAASSTSFRVTRKRSMRSCCIPTSRR